MTGLQGLDKLTKNDIVYLFYSKNTPHLPMELVKTINECKALIEPIKSDIGKNAMDFIIATFLGYKVHEYGTRDNYFILSKDKGYQPLVSFWEDWNAKLVSSLLQVVKPTKTSKTIKKVAGGKNKEDQALRCNIGRVLSGYQKTLKHSVVDIIETSKNKTEVNNKLVKLLNDTKEAGKIYKLIKDFI